MGKNMPAAKELAMPWARRRWAAVEHMTVRGRSRSAGAAKCRPVAGRMAGRRDSESAAASVPGAFDRPVRTLGSGSALFAARIAGHQPVPTGLVAPVIVRPPADVATGLPEVAPITPANPRQAVARPSVPVMRFPTEPALDDPSSVRMRRVPVPPARGFMAPAAYQSLSGWLGMYALARWRVRLQLSTWRRLPREVDWVGWRARTEPTLLASFAVIVSATALIGLYSFSSGGLYNPVTPTPSQTQGPPPDSPAANLAPGVRAIRQAPGAHGAPGTNGPSLPQFYASWPAPADSAQGSTPGTGSARSTTGVPAVPRTSAARGGGGGGGGGPSPSPSPSVTSTPSPSPTDTTPPPSDSGTPTASDTTTPPAGP